MTKEEKIKEAWVNQVGDKRYNALKEELVLDGFLFYQPSDLIEVDVKIIDGLPFYRPKELKGIENNNGWNSMDQPDFEDNEYILFLRFIEGEGEPPIFTCVLCDDFEIGYFTHWKRINYKKPPLY